LAVYELIRAVVLFTNFYSTRQFTGPGAWSTMGMTSEVLQKLRQHLINRDDRKDAHRVVLIDDIVLAIALFVEDNTRSWPKELAL
jgi:hypothetical protein